MKTLEDVAGELQVDYQSTIEKLSSQVSSHAIALEDVNIALDCSNRFIFLISFVLSSIEYHNPHNQCFKGIVSEADKVLIELQSSLTEQEDKLVAFTHLQHEVCKY